MSRISRSFCLGKGNGARAWMLGAPFLLLSVIICLVIASAPVSSQAEAMPGQVSSLGVSKGAQPERVVHGETVTYTVVFSNNSQVATTLHAITDTIDSSLSFVAMAESSDVSTMPTTSPGQLVWMGPVDVPADGRLTLVYQVETADTESWSSPCNQVRAAAMDGLVGPVGTCITVGPAKSYLWLPTAAREFRPAHFAVTKSALPTTVSTDPGEVVTYTVTIRNEGDTTGSLLTVADVLPQGFSFLSMVAGSDLGMPGLAGQTLTWSPGMPLAPGEEKMAVYQVAPSQTGGTYVNNVTVTAQGASVPEAPSQATVTVQSNVLLQEDFDGGIGRWTAFLNHSRLEPGQWYWGANDGLSNSGALTHNCCTGDKVASDALMMYLGDGAQEWTDYRVEMVMYLTGGVDKDGNTELNSGDPIGFWIRGQYQQSELQSQWVSGYYVVLVGKSGSESHFVRIGKMQQPGDCEACLKPYRMYNFDNPMFKARSEDLAGPFEHYRWYKLAVEVRGANIKVFLDDRPVLDWTDPLLPFTSGTVGFKVHETKTASFDNITVTRLP